MLIWIKSFKKCYWFCYAIVKYLTVSLAFNFIMQYLFQSWYFLMINFLFQLTTTGENWELYANEYSTFEIVAVSIWVGLWSLVLVIVQAYVMIKFKSIWEDTVMFASLWEGYSNKRWVFIIHIFHFFFIWIVILTLIAIPITSISKWIILIIL